MLCNVLCVILSNYPLSRVLLKYVVLCNLHVYKNN